MLHNSSVHIHCSTHFIAIVELFLVLRPVLFLHSLIKDSCSPIFPDRGFNSFVIMSTLSLRRRITFDTTVHSI